MDIYLPKKFVICIFIGDFLDHSAINHVITHLRHLLATYDRVRIIRKPDNPRTDNQE
jgi:hypothetical protein